MLRRGLGERVMRAVMRVSDEDEVGEIVMREEVGTRRLLRFANCCHYRVCRWYCESVSCGE